MIIENKKLKLYKYVSIVGFIKSYCKQEIWLTPVNELNDPFEAHTKIKQFSPECILNNPDLFHLSFQEHQKAIPNLTEKHFVHYIKSPEYKLDIAKYEEKIRCQHKNFGITSFSSDPKNIPMWTYYANTHQGYCIELEMDFNKIQQTNNISESAIERLLNDMNDNKFILSFFSDENEFVFSKGVNSI